MRTRLGWALCVLGVLVALLGVAVMIMLGPDNRRSTGPHRVDTNGIAVVTAPNVISWADVQVDILAEVPVSKPVFIGIGNTVDVQNYLGKTKRLEVTEFATPWKVTTKQAAGAGGLPGAPTAVDWWIVQSAGLGGASVSTTLPDESVSVAILTVGSTNLSGLEVTLAYGIKGGFYKGVGLLLLGLGITSLGLVLRRGAWRDDEGDEPIGEEIVYVHVDEDGVERELTAEEAQQYEIVDESVKDEQVPEPEAAPAPEHGPEPEALRPPEPVAPRNPDAMTAGEIVAAQDAVPEPQPAGEPDPEGVVYIFVDEDGVEHEVGEDELAGFEVVDDEEDES